MKTFLELFVATFFAVCISLLGYTITKQQKTIDLMQETTDLMLELDQTQEDKLWDLHRRVIALEEEDTRIMAHVRWFVMRRSGTNELRKMEAAVAKLEAGRAGD